MRHSRFLTGSTDWRAAACFYNSGAAGLGVTMLSCGDKFCLNFKQSFLSDQYVKAFCAELDKMGIAYRAGDAIAFVTPKDSLMKRKKKSRTTNERH